MTEAPNLMTACLLMNIELVSNIIKEAIDDNNVYEIISRQNGIGWNAFHKACRDAGSSQLHEGEKSIQIAKIILDACPADKLVDLLSIRVNLGFTPLALAARSNAFEVIEMIMQKIPSEKKFEILSIRDNKGRTAYANAEEMIQSPEYQKSLDVLSDGLTPEQVEDLRQIRFPRGLPQYEIRR